MVADTEAKEFKRLTKKLMLLKYAYYVHSDNIVSDFEYDVIEKEWHRLGKRLKLLEDDETSPCVDFSYRHPEANWAAHCYFRIKEHLKRRDV